LAHIQASNSRTTTKPLVFLPSPLTNDACAAADIYANLGKESVRASSDPWQSQLGEIAAAWPHSDSDR